MTTESSLPSQVLNSPFILKDTDSIDSQSDLVEASTTFWTHSYSVAGMGLLLPEGTVGEVFDELPMCRIPNTNEWLHGIASQRGNVVPIFDLAKMFDLETVSADKKRKYFLIGQREKAVGILIDEMPARISLDRKERLTSAPPLPEMLQPFAHACYQTDNKVWVDWDVDAFFLMVGERV